MPSPGQSGDEFKESKFQRFQRVLGFAASFARARRREFELLWRERGKHGQKAEEFVRRVDLLMGMVKKGEGFLALAKGQSNQQALATLASFDLEQLGAATRGLEKLARELKDDPGLQAAVTGLLTAPPARTRDLLTNATGELDLGKETRRLMGMVRGWLTPAAPVVAMLQQNITPATSTTQRNLTGHAAQPAGPKPAPARTLDPKNLEHQAFGAAIDLVQSVLEKVNARLKVVDVSLVSTGLPAKRRAWEDVERDIPDAGIAAGLQPSQVGWALMLAELFLREARAVQVAHMAITQWRQACSLLVEARELKSRADKVGEASRAGVLAAFHVGKFKATAFPLSHLHLTFKGFSPLQDLFPPP
jgi:hypothetical protein